MYTHIQEIFVAIQEEKKQNKRLMQIKSECIMAMNIQLYSAGSIFCNPTPQDWWEDTQKAAIS